jgi:hypothetical protein
LVLSTIQTIQCVHTFAWINGYYWYCKQDDLLITCEIQWDFCWEIVTGYVSVCCVTISEIYCMWKLG